MADYAAVVAGTGFASTFFLHEYLAHAPADARVLVLEAGRRYSHAEQLALESSLAERSRGAVDNRTPEKPWVFTLAFGGGSNCWWACTPRLLESDFELYTRYGVGRDWPLRYADLDPWYGRAEQLMEVSGPERSPYPRSTPYPQPPHEGGDPDRILAAAHPDGFFVQPTARPRRPTRSGSPACCANSVCQLCPIDSKFTIENGLAATYADPRVRLELGAPVEAVEVEGGVARGVTYRQDGRDARASAELVVLGANALFNPHILLRSGMQHPELGRNLFEQSALRARVLLDGVEGMQGSTSITGHGYMLYDGEHRREAGAVLIETHNVPSLRRERGRWRELLDVLCIVEDLPRSESRVTFDPADPDRPVVHSALASSYARRGAARAKEKLADVMAPLPVEGIEFAPELEDTEFHMLGTVAMGDDPASSVVDRDLRHHEVRNLLVLGGSAFPTGSPANPTLTLSALSLRAAAELFV